MALIFTVNQHFDGTINVLHSMAFATNNSTDNTFTIKKMLQQEDVLDFIQAMMKEIDDHESRNHWSLV